MSDDVAARSRLYWQAVNVATVHGDMVAGSNVVALEVQQPWVDLLLDCRKTVETRRYPFPPWLIGKRLVILQSGPGTSGISAVPDEVWPADPRYTLPGYIVVGECIRYATRSAWEADAQRHCVPIDDVGAYGWRDDLELYGWAVTSAGRTAAGPGTCPSLHRIHRSFFIVPTEADLRRAAEEGATRRAAPPADFAAHGPLEELAMRMRDSAAPGSETQSYMR